MDSEKSGTKSGNNITPRRRRYRVTDHDFVAPDGGWSWLVMVACGISNLCIFPVIQLFGLIFLERFATLGISTVQTTTIVNVNSALTYFVGLFNGPVYRQFSYRQVALFGSFMVVISLMVLIFCKSFWSYLVCFGIFYGCGIGITQTANAIALNTYFKNKRSIATGLSWGITAFGPIILPYVTTAFMGIYNANGTILIFSAFAGHSVFLSLLLQPVHWHTKFRETDEPVKTTNTKLELEFQEANNGKKEKSLKLPNIRNIVETFGLDLLNDPIFINLMIGMDLTKFCEVNFTIMTPFVLTEFKFSSYEIATFMSLLGATDIVARFCVPFVGRKLGLNIRIYFMVGVLCTALGRVLLIHTQNFTISLVSAFMIGFGKGVIVVQFCLLLPNHVSLKKLPSAIGLQLALSGVIFLTLGPILGWIKDTVQNYVITLHVLNVFNYVTVASWSMELIKTKCLYEKS